MAAYIEVDVTVTVMRPTGQSVVESGDTLVRYYFAAPDRWSRFSDATLGGRLSDIANRMYSDVNVRRRAAEPSEQTFMKVKGVRARVLTPDEVNTWPWVSIEAPAWEPSPAVVVNGDGSYSQVSALELGNAVPAELPVVRLDGILPALLDRQLPACVGAYQEAYPSFREPRPLDQSSAFVWGAAVLFVCVLDRLAAGGEFADPFATIGLMIDWLAEDGVAPRESIESARQIFKKMMEYNVFRPHDTLAQFSYERAWSIRYSDIPLETPTAFAGFVRCLAGCQPSLRAFDIEEPARSARAIGPVSPVFARIDAFNKRVVLPAFAEMRETLERKGLRVAVSQDGAFGDPFLETFFREIHPHARFVGELATPASATAKATEYLGHTLLVMDADPPPNRYAGKYFETMMFVAGSDESIAAAPFVIYHMRFDNKLHGFRHRYDDSRPYEPIESLDKYAIQNHFLKSYDFYKLHAKSDVRPW